MKISSVYQKDKNRSQRVFDSFIDALNNIRDKLSTSTLQYPLFQNKIDSFYNKSKNDSNRHPQENHNNQQHIDEDVGMHDYIKQEPNINITKSVDESYINHHIKQESPPISPLSPPSPKETSPTNSSSVSLNNNNLINHNQQNVLIKIKDENESDNNRVNQGRSDMNVNNNRIELPQFPQFPNLPQLPSMSQINHLNMNNNGNVPVHLIQNGEIGRMEIMNNMNRYSNIAINNFIKLQRDEINNRVIGYQIESLNGGQGPFIIKQYILFPNN